MRNFRQEEEKNEILGPHFLGTLEFLMLFVLFFAVVFHVCAVAVVAFGASFAVFLRILCVCVFFPFCCCSVLLFCTICCCSCIFVFFATLFAALVASCALLLLFCVMLPALWVVDR